MFLLIEATGTAWAETVLIDVRNLFSSRSTFFAMHDKLAEAPADLFGGSRTSHFCEATVATKVMGFCPTIFLKV